MRNINDIYELLQFVCNKNQRGYISPGEFNRAINAVSMQLFKEKIGLPEEYQLGRPIPRVALGITLKNLEDVDPFIKEVEMTGATTTGWVKPADFVYPVSMYSVQALGRKSIDLVGHQELNDALASTVFQPTTEYPIAASVAGKIKVYPVNTPACHVTFLRMPQGILWAGTLVSGRLVYDEATSTQPEWPQATWNELFTRCLSLFGVNLKAQDITQYSVMKKQEGM